jgi:hypothetical protein
LQSYRPLLRRQVLTAKCHGGRSGSLPLLQTAVGSQPPLEMAVPCYFCQCWIQLFIFVKSCIYIYKRYSIPDPLRGTPTSRTLAWFDQFFSGAWFFWGGSFSRPVHAWPVLPESATDFFLRLCVPTFQCF